MSKLFNAVSENWIEVAEKHDGDSGESAYLGNHFQHALQGSACYQGALRSCLNNRPVGGRIGKRNADFQNIHSGFFKARINFLVTLSDGLPPLCPHLLGLLDRSPLPDAERLAVTLSNDIDALPQRIALVLDDYHWITESAIQCVINEFLRHPLRKLHLVLTSRSQPALALSRLRSNRYLCELHMQDLRLTEPEAAALLAQRIPVALSSEEVTVLVARTEGWAAGLHLAALSLEAEGSIDSYTADYLLEQVLLQQQPVVRDFLLKTSILDRLSPDLAEAVVGSEQSATGITLQALARKGLFLQATDRSADGSEAWYTVHRLFRTLLRQQLEATASPSQVAVLHRRASAWYCRQRVLR